MADNNPEVRVGVAVLIECDGKILFGLRKGSHGAGTWSLPGGHLDFGEEPETTAIRECKEETGLIVGKVKRYRKCQWVNTHFPKDNKQYITLYFTAEYQSGVVRLMEPDKCERWEFFDKDNLPSPLFEPLAESGIMSTV